MLSNAEGIKGALSKVYFELQENETSGGTTNKKFANSVRSLPVLSSGFACVVAAIAICANRIEGYSGEVGRISDHINYDPEKIEQLNERLSVGYKLLKKHGVQTTAELLKIQKQFEEKLQAVLNIDEAIQQKEKESALISERSGGH